MTPRQRQIAAAVGRVTLAGADKWYRAGAAGIGHPRGEAVTLASLHKAGVLVRRVWRTGKSSRDNAYEYRWSKATIAAWREVQAASKAAG